MRRKNPLRAALGWILLVMGALILFARVLPPVFWWFCFGAGLVALGFFLIRGK